MAALIVSYSYEVILVLFAGTVAWTALASWCFATVLSEDGPWTVATMTNALGVLVGFVGLSLF